MQKIVIGCLIASLFIMTYTAYVATQQNYFIKVRHSEKYLTVYESSQNNGGNVIQGERQHQFEKIDVGDGFFFLRAQHSNKCVQVYQRSQENGANVNQWDCQNEPHFKWKFQSGGDGYGYIINQNSNKCLQVDQASQSVGANVIQWECQNRDNFLWKFE